MIYKIFTIYDSKIGVYAKPFVMQTRGEALRGWMDIVNDDTTQFFKHPEDFTLFEIASYNDETGTFENNNTPHSVGTAVEFRKRGVPEITTSERAN